MLRIFLVLRASLVSCLLGSAAARAEPPPACPIVGFVAGQRDWTAPPQRPWAGVQARLQAASGSCWTVPGGGAVEVRLRLVVTATRRATTPQAELVVPVPYRVSLVDPAGATAAVLDAVAELRFAAGAAAAGSEEMLAPLVPVASPAQAGRWTILAGFPLR